MGMDNIRLYWESIYLMVYDNIVKNYSVETEDAIDENLDEDLVQSSEKKNFKYYFSKVILFMGQAMTPFITVVYGAGMLRVVLSLVSYFAPAAAESSTYQLFDFRLQAPVLILADSGSLWNIKSIESKSPHFSIAMAAALLYPNFIAMMEAGEAVTMMKLPVYLTTYGSTLLPGIFSAILVAYLEKLFYKIIPGMLRSVFAPLCVFLIGYPLTVLVLGPGRRCCWIMDCKSNRIYTGSCGRICAWNYCGNASVFGNDGS